MPKVFTGKVAIPGDKIDEYFKALEKAEEERAPFRKSLEALSDAFDAHLASRLSRRTARRHSMTIKMFVEFLCRQTDVQSLDEVTVGMANSHFRNWYKRKVMDNATDNDLKNGVQKFFQFLADEQGIVNRKVLGSFSRVPEKSWSQGAGSGQATVVIRAKVIGNKRIWRDVEIPTSKPLYALAEGILEAFNFNMDHAFGFYATDNPRKYFDAPVKYVLFADMGEASDRRTKGVKRSNISDAFAHEGQKMIFLFDYGDEWLFELEVRTFGVKESRSRYPRVLTSRGTAPAQYGEWDEEDAEDDG